MIKKIFLFITFFYIFKTQNLIFSAQENFKINSIDTAILNEACKLVLSDNVSDDLEDFYEEQAALEKDKILSVPKTTVHSVLVRPGNVTAAYGQVHSDFDGIDKQKRITCCWYYEDAPQEIKELAKDAIALQKEKEEMNWLEKHVSKAAVRFLNKLTGPFREKSSIKPFFTKATVPAGTYATIKMHIKGNGENMDSSFYCTLDLEGSEENKKKSLSSAVLTELLEAHVDAKKEAIPLIKKQPKSPR